MCSFPLLKGDLICSNAAFLFDHPSCPTILLPWAWKVHSQNMFFISRIFTTPTSFFPSNFPTTSLQLPALKSREIILLPRKLAWQWKIPYFLSEMMGDTSSFMVVSHQIPSTPTSKGSAAVTKCPSNTAGKWSAPRGWLPDSKPRKKTWKNLGK